MRVTDDFCKTKIPNHKRAISAMPKRLKLCEQLDKVMEDIQIENDFDNSKIVEYQVDLNNNKNGYAGNVSLLPQSIPFLRKSRVLSAV